MALIEGRLVSTITTCCLLSSAFVRLALSVFSRVPSIWASESGTVVVSVQEMSNVYKNYLHWSFRTRGFTLGALDDFVRPTHM